MNKLKEFIKMCRLSESSFLIILIRFVLYKLRGKSILAHQRARIKGVSNIKHNKPLWVGTSYLSFMHKKDWTFVNIRGKMNIADTYSIGRGCRVYVGPNGVINIGSGGFMNGNTLVKVQHELNIGDDCAISWGCQIIDDDYHEIMYEGYRPKPKSVSIGNHVWLGSKVCVYAGTTIPDNCVVAANSVVRGVFTEENALIAGNPAKVIKRNVSWK